MRTVEIDIPELEDKVLNVLNSILMICYGNNVYNDVEKEIMAVVDILVNKNLINKRITPTQTTCPKGFYRA